jgi:hypothetical protein
MANSDTKRDYLMTDGELTAFTQLVCSNITRDILEFTPYAVTPLLVTNLQTLCDAFEVFPSDDIYNMEYQAATEVKDNLISEMKVIIRSMALRAEIKWGKSSPYYKNLGIADMSQLSDDNYISRCRKIHKILTGYLSELASGGLTQDILDDMEDKIQALDDAKFDQGEKNIARTIKSIERVAKGNELYALVSQYCEIGKTIWYGVNSAKYNSYVIYTPGPGSLTAPTGLRFYFPNLAFYWEMVEHASSYQVEASLNGTDYFEIYAGSDLVCPYTPIQENFMWYRARARSANGFGPYSDVLKQGYYAGTILPPPSNLAVELVSGTTNSVKFTWAEVPSATNYKISKSIVEVGADVGAYSYIGQADTIEYIETVDSGHRYYYHVAAENSNQWSPVSGDAFIEL